MTYSLTDSEIRKLRQLLRTIPCNGLDTYVAGSGISIQNTNCCHIKEIISTGQGPQGPIGPQGPQGIQGIQGIQGTPGLNGVGYHGSFYDTTTQSVASGGIAAMKFNNTDLTATSGFSLTNNGLGNPTRITAANTGVYNLQFSAQLNRSTGGNAKQIDIWIAVNGTPIPDTNTGITMQANDGKIVAAWNYFVKLNAGQYVEIMWTQDDSIDILYAPANLTVPYPATPSVIATICQIG